MNKIIFYSYIFYYDNFDIYIKIMNNVQWIIDK